MKRLLLVGCVSFCFFSGLPASRASIIVNGSFETYAKLAPTWSTPFAEDDNLTPGNTDILGWTVINGQIDYVGVDWVAADGTRSLDLDGSPGIGGVSQTFATTPGRSYIVTFDMSGNPGGAGPPPDISYPFESKTKSMRVTAVGLVTDNSADYTFDIATKNNNAVDMKWQLDTFSFTADAASTTLSFFSTDAPNPNGPKFGPVIDNVSISDAAVPEPSSIALTGLGLSLLGFYYACRCHVRRRLQATAS